MSVVDDTDVCHLAAAAERCRVMGQSGQGRTRGFLTFITHNKRTCVQWMGARSVQHRIAGL